MKWMMIGFMLGLGILGGNTQQEETVLNLPPDSPFVLKGSGGEITHPDQGSPDLLVSRQTPATFVNITEYSHDATILRIPNPKITSPQYALIGEVAYKNVPTHSQLELVTNYLAGGTNYSRTDSDGGLQQRLSGSSEFRPFVLPVRLSDPGRVTQVELHVKLQGESVVATPYGTTHEETVSLRNLKLVQYPTAPSQKLDASKPIPLFKETSLGIDWKSFLLGVVATGVSLLAGGGIIFISRRWNHRRHERELRRIASLDS